jgi:predicted CXXCH cytochrome family protein
LGYYYNVASIKHYFMYVTFIQPAQTKTTKQQKENSNMKLVLNLTAIAAAMTLVIGTAQAASVASSTSKHNLSTTGTVGAGAQTNVGISGKGTPGETTGVDSQVCVFCHTPHGSTDSADAPIWNKPALAGNTGVLGTEKYTRYASTTLDATNVAVGSVSLACLSCHDGTQAMNAVVNAPGSGNDQSLYEASAAMGTNADSNGVEIPNLSTDLSNDHPISMQYAGGGCKVGAGTHTAACGTLTDPDFVTPVGNSINNTPMWWVNTDAGTGFNDMTAGATIGGDAVTGQNTRQKTDMILYTRGIGDDRQPYVECASCHDPHQTVSQPVQFLRIDNDGSKVCLACHIK